MSASTQSSEPVLPDAEQGSPSSGENATAPNRGQAIQQSSPESSAARNRATDSQASSSTPVTKGKRKVQHEDRTDAPSQDSTQAGPSSTKRPRITPPDVQIPVDSNASELSTTVQSQVPIVQSVSRSTGKRKQRDEEEASSADNSAATQASPNQTPLASTSPENEDDPPTKKQRLDTETDSAVVESEPRCSPLLTLPFELLAEILVRTGSSQHVLATARTCKALCQALLSPDAVFIWREARKSCTYAQNGKNFALPDPPKQFFSEPAYAAFLFDSGPCDNCQNETSVLYFSFGLKIRLCKRVECTWSSLCSSEKIFSAGDVLLGSQDHLILTVLPTNEASERVLHHRTNAVPNPSLFNFSLFCRTEDRNRELIDLQANAEEYQRTISLRAKRKLDWTEFCGDVLRWKKAREGCYKTVAAKNEQSSKDFASKHGWNHEMLMQTVYGTYTRNKTALIEEIDDVDVEVMKSQIEDRLLSLGEKRTRRSNEVMLMKNRSEVEKTYDRLRSAKEYAYMPSLYTFRRLPVVEMLQSSVSSDMGSIYDTLKDNKRMKDLLSSQINGWAARAKADLGQLMGSPKNWKNASKKVLHPAERATARYLCRRCDRLDVKYRADECMDFAGACLHQCAFGNGKTPSKLRTGKKAIWDSKNFVKDEKAVKVLKSAAEAFRFTEDLGEGTQFLESGFAVICTSCSPTMVLDSRTIIGHSHRHEDMKMTFGTPAKEIISLMGGYPFEYGLVQKLLGPTSSSISGKAEIDKVNYGCRHCLRANQILDPSAAAAAMAGALKIPESNDDHVANRSSTSVDLSFWVYRMHSVGIAGPSIRPPPLFSFNGIRSHMKAKHDIKNIRDEDILCYRPPDVN